MPCPLKGGRIKTFGQVIHRLNRPSQNQKKKKNLISNAKLWEWLTQPQVGLRNIKSSTRGLTQWPMPKNKMDLQVSLASADHCWQRLEISWQRIPRINQKRMWNNKETCGSQKSTSQCNNGKSSPNHWEHDQDIWTGRELSRWRWSLDRDIVCNSLF